MASEWRTVKLGEVIELKRGYDLPARERRPGPYPIVSSSGVSDFHFEPKVQGPGVVTGRYGTLGEVFYVKEDFWPLNTALYVRDFKGNNPRFVSYFLKTLNFLAFSDKAAVPGPNRNHLHSATVRIPNVTVQQAIACILGSLDDKIELNRRMNRTLEEMARAIFKSWFIDFDPVRAKAAVRREHPKWTDEQVSRAACPNLKPEIARLFPDSFEDSELGEIPKGWAISTVDEAFDLTMGQSPPGETYNETGDGLPFYQGRADFGFRFPKRRVFCTVPTRLAKRGDTLVSVRAPVGDINMASEDCAIGRGVGSIRHKSGSRSFTYYSMRALESQFEVFEAEGTVFGSISKKDFHRLAVMVPPESLVAEFERLFCPVDDAIECNEQESGTLAALRDALLPKLISGELRIPDAERIAQRKV